MVWTSLESYHTSSHGAGNLQISLAFGFRLQNSVEPYNIFFILFFFITISYISRYTFFIILYPIGITGELLCIWSAYQYASETNMWSFVLPNAVNFTFDYGYFLIGSMLAYIPGKNEWMNVVKISSSLLIFFSSFLSLLLCLQSSVKQVINVQHQLFFAVFPQLYFYMFAQRKRVLMS